MKNFKPNQLRNYQKIIIASIIHCRKVGLIIVEVFQLKLSWKNNMKGLFNFQQKILIFYWLSYLLPNLMEKHFHAYNLRGATLLSITWYLKSNFTEIWPLLKSTGFSIYLHAICCVFKVRTTLLKCVNSYVNKYYLWASFLASDYLVKIRCNGNVNSSTQIPWLNNPQIGKALIFSLLPIGNKLGQFTIQVISEWQPVFWAFYPSRRHCQHVLTSQVLFIGKVAY